MKDSTEPSLFRSAIQRLSRTAVGRASNQVGQLFGGKSTLISASRFLRRQLWAWPIIAGVVFGGVGLLIHRSVETAMRGQRESELTTILNADVAALRVWIGEQAKTARLFAEDERLTPAVTDLLKQLGGTAASQRALLQSELQLKIRERLTPRLLVNGFHGYFIVTPSGVVLSCDQDVPIGLTLGGYRQEFFTRVLKSDPAVSRPYPSPMLLKNEAGEFRANLPTMIAASAILDAEGKPVAVLGLRIPPEREFTKILQVARAGETGETYAFDRDGVMLSSSRFDADLKSIGLLPDLPESQSLLTLLIRDPGVDMTAGSRPKLRRQEQPLTKAVAESVEGRPGCDPEGYRDYRGVAVVGAWTWLPEFEFGVATEIDCSESFAPLHILRRAFWVLMGLLGLCAATIYFAMIFMSRQQNMLQAAVLEARRLGQYKLMEKIGQGGMGTVYLAQHSMLRRPTAIKLLDSKNVSDAAIARFEREVQLTSSLTHPNTVAVFDFGRTPENVFYYVMEYLEGLNLDDLIKTYGPVSEARLVYLMKQVCGSLAEAHAAGLVHRDVKPANIFLTRRGGQSDFVKMLDFGLVKAVENREDGNITAANVITGTPLYLSPEAIQFPDQVDVRSDVYALGAVAYFLIAGSPVFDGKSIMDICMKHVNVLPEPPSVRLGKPISAGLEQLILKCLAKKQHQRPADAAELLTEMEQCTVIGSWTASNAAHWWSTERHLEPTLSATIVTNGVELKAPHLESEMTIDYRFK